jgi:hypothetical protein
MEVHVMVERRSERFSWAKSKDKNIRLMTENIVKDSNGLRAQNSQGQRK